METKCRFEITPDDRNKIIDLKQLHEYRDLVFLMVKRDFIASYKQTFLGPLWAILRPLLTTVAYILIFGNIAKLSTSDISGQTIIPGFLFYLSGTICWGYFSSTISGVSGSFSGNTKIMGKVYFPRIVVPVSTALSKFISFAIQFVMLISAIIYYAVKGSYVVKPGISIVFVPLLLLQLMLLALGIGMIISSLTIYYRDLHQIMSFIMQIWHYSTPVAYGLTLIPSKFRMFYLLNPVTPIITGFRLCLFGEGFFNIKVSVISIVITLIIYLTGRYMYSRAEKNFMDTI